MPETQFYLSIQERNIPLNYYTNLTQTDIPQLQTQGNDDIVARINPNPKNRAILGLKNCSTQIWTVTLPTGEIRQIQIGQTIKLEENTQINFGLIYGLITRNNFNYPTDSSNDGNIIYQTISDEDQKENDNKKDKKVTAKSLIMVSLLGLVLASPILIYSLFANETSQDEPENSPPEASNTCDGLVSRRGKLGISNWYEVNKRFWEETDYPYGKELDTNHPNYNYYQEQWCKIANEWLLEKEKSTIDLPANDTPNSEPTSLSESTIPVLSEREAVELIKTWLGAKSKIFSYPYDRSLMSNLLIDKALAKVKNAVNKLEQNQQYYNIGEQQIEGINNFFKSKSSNEAIIDVILQETYQLYNNQGEVDTKERDYYHGIMRFHLIYFQNKWRIYDYENIKNL